jgi:hypothetical protein
MSNPAARRGVAEPWGAQILREVADLLTRWGMTKGSERTDVAYVWPRTLRQPSRPPKLVYLDLNHWITLAKASTGRPDGTAHRLALETCLAAVADGRALFPLSEVTFMEVSRNSTPRQRKHLADVMEELSRFYVVTSRTVLATHEIEATLEAKFGQHPMPVRTTDYLDWGVGRALGLVGEFRVYSSADGTDVTEAARAEFAGGPDCFDALIAAAQIELQRCVLRGPSTPEEEADLRSRGYDPMAAHQVTVERAEQELEQVRVFNADPDWRRGRIRDVIAAREFMIELNGLLAEAAVARGITELADLFSSPEEARPFFDSMPSTDVSITLKTAYHRDPNHQWRHNDIHDIDMLAITVPYCDVVVTDRAVCHHVNATGLASRCETVALYKLDDLIKHL